MMAFLYYVQDSHNNVRDQQLDPADDQAVNSRLLIWRQRMHESQSCCGELTELTVDDIWQIRSQLLATSNFRDWHTVVDEIPWSSVLKTTMDCHSKLVLHLLRNNQPMQVIVHQPRQTTLIFPGPSDQTRRAAAF